MQNKDLCTRREAAALLGLEPQTLAKWAMTGRNLSVIRISSRAVRYCRAEIAEFIERCTARSSSANGNANGRRHHE